MVAASRRDGSTLRAMTSMTASPCQWIEIDAAALRSNVCFFRDTIGPATALMAVVKSNAYGHGLAQVTEVADPLVDWFGVHGAEEARELRGLGVRRPVLIMGFVPPTEFRGLVGEDHLAISTLEEIDWAAEYRGRSGVSLPLHLKVDTGTNRQGFEVEEVGAACRRAARQGLSVVGVMTHFANIEDTLEHEFARRQLEAFERARQVIRSELGEEPQHVHAACSAAALLFREADFSMARIGISMYGHWPSRETHLSWILAHGRNNVRLRPTLRWKAQVGQIQRVESGETVGYGRTWKALRPTRLAVLPVGYADGYPRSLGNRARVLASGRLLPVVGRVCMNVMMVDVTDAPEVSVGAEVLLLGGQGDSGVSAEELARLADTINYELLARLSPRIPRLLVEG